MKFAVKIFKTDELINFNIFIKIFYINPTDEDIINNEIEIHLTEYIFDKGYEYDTYKFPFETIINAKYLGIYIKSKKYFKADISIEYDSSFIYPQNSLVFI